MVELGLHLPQLPAPWDEVLDGHHLPVLVWELLQHLLLQSPVREGEECGRGGQWERCGEGEGVGRCGGIPDHYSLLEIELQFLKV